MASELDVLFKLLSEVGLRAVPLLEVRGALVSEEDLLVLEAIAEAGSIKRASERLGAGYRAVWESLERLESSTGLRLVERETGGAGGGGAHLTLAGEALLAKARLASRRLRRELERLGEPDVVIAGSDCVLMERLVEELADRGCYALYVRVGSSLGVEALKRGYCGIAGVHILDPETGKYNEHLLRDPELKGRVVLVKGWRRVLGLAYRESLRPPPAGIADVVDRGLRLANRVRGSGTRIFLDYALARLAAERGVAVSALKRRVRGYDTEYVTHSEAAAAVAAGKADVAVTVEWAARTHGLQFTPLAVEEYDLLVDKRVLGRVPLAQTPLFGGKLTIVE